MLVCFFFQAEDGIRDAQESRGLGDVYKRQHVHRPTQPALTLLVTNSSWKVRLSDTQHIGRWRNSDFGGDRVDARLSIPDWATPSSRDAGWSNPREFNLSQHQLSPDLAEPNRVREQIRANSVAPYQGGFLVVFEQVFTGFVTLELVGPPNSTVGMDASSVPLCSSSPKPVFCATPPAVSYTHLTLPTKRIV
eukprot:TRINITY_DN26667_c0_g1_i2.p1 TRINITY_DN26667_c0_g1~~TRINITY_DN26667_c0_g1_i2.p1  ORF type:complete len:192 (+),score=35.74 TRINITY_DN26667_c0_g1_i2:21-596(+)